MPGGETMNDSDSVREQVIEVVRSGKSDRCRSGAWLAIRTRTGRIELFRFEEDIDL